MLEMEVFPLYFTGFFGKTPGACPLRAGIPWSRRAAVGGKGVKKAARWLHGPGLACAVRVLGLGGGVRAVHVEKTRKILYLAGFHWSG